MKRKPSEASLERYDWQRARRGRWAGRLRTARSVLIRPEVYAEFGSDDAINAALLAVVRLRHTRKGPPKRRRRAA